MQTACILYLESRLVEVMVMEKAACKAALAALEKAMEVERQGRVFYEEAAGRVQDAAGKAVFQTLAKDEVEHIRLLQAEYDQISKNSEWMELDDAKVCEPQTPLKLFPGQTDPALAIPARIKDVDALKLAMGFEERGYKAYKKAQKDTDDPSGKKVYAFLAKQENNHYVFLQKTCDYLSNEGAWYFDEQEFPMFDGG
jgi:rubrerythrin